MSPSPADPTAVATPRAPATGPGLGRLYVIAGSTAILVLLHVIYVHYVSPLFGSAVYRYVEPSTSSLIAHGLIALCPALWLPLRITRPSQIAYWFHYYALYMPAVLIPLYLGEIEETRLLLFSLLLLVLFAGIGLSHHLPLLSVVRPKMGARTFLAGLLLASAAVLGLTVVLVGIRGFSLDLTTVYDVRGEMDAFVERHGARMVYLTTWAGNVIHPALLALGLATRRRWLVVVGVGGQLVLFWALALKSILFSVPLSLVLYFLLRRREASFATRFITGICIVIPVCLFIDSFLEIPWATALTLRRIMVVPGVLTGYYLDFFGQNPHLFLSDNVLSAFFDYPYRMGVTNLIGMTYLNDVTASANVNYWVSAYAHFGLVGLPVFTLLFAVYGWLYDSLARGRSLVVTGILMGLPAITLTNSSLQTSLLTHGLGVLLVVLYFLPRSATGGTGTAEERVGETEPAPSSRALEPA